MGMLKVNSGGTWVPVAPSSTVDPGFVGRAGDTMTGSLLLPSGDPPEDAAVARKKYVDDLNRVFKASDTVTWDEAIQPGLYPILLRGNLGGGTGPGIGIYYYVLNHIYAGAVDDDLSGAHTRNMTQVAIPYSSSNVYDICTRDRYSNVWTSWSSPYSYRSVVFPFAAAWQAHPSYACYVERSRNIVCLRGLAQPTADVSVGTSTIGTLAAEFRPPGSILLPVITSYNGSNFRTPDRLNISSAGVVSIQAVTAAATFTTAGWVTLVSSWVV